MWAVNCEIVFKYMVIEKTRAQDFAGIGDFVIEFGELPHVFQALCFDGFDGSAVFWLDLWERETGMLKNVRFCFDI
jgi:hypothetical protein